MMRSLFAGVQGLRSHQTRMDVIGNNIANVNTLAFKASRVNFAEMYNQTIAGATTPTRELGGVNPRQIGLGVGVAAIENVMTDGSLQLTGKNTDVAVSGNGFFVLRDGPRRMYTRAGAFNLDAEGNLVNPQGLKVQGWLANPATGTFPTRDVATMQDIVLNIADSVLPQQTATVQFDQTLNEQAPWSPTPTVKQVGATVYDSLGEAHTVTLDLTKTGPTQWSVAITIPGASPPAPTITPPSTLDFDSQGRIIAGTGLLSVSGYDPGNGANVMSFNLDFTKVIHTAMGAANTDSTIRSLRSDGYPSGSLTGVTIDPRGVVTGFYSNGQYREVAQLALANFFNPAGLSKEAGNNWTETPNSGQTLIGAASTSGRGSIVSGNLEMSNVDIASEFTNMIVTQRGFQANSRIISVTDELLQDVVNLKR